MVFGLGATELLLILIVIVILFMLPKKLPELIKSFKQAKDEWNKSPEQKTETKESPVEKKEESPKVKPSKSKK